MPMFVKILDSLQERYRKPLVTALLQRDRSLCDPDVFDMFRLCNLSFTSLRTALCSAYVLPSDRNVLNAFSEAWNDNDEVAPTNAPQQSSASAERIPLDVKTDAACEKVVSSKTDDGQHTGAQVLDLTALQKLYQIIQGGHCHS